MDFFARGDAALKQPDEYQLIEFHSLENRAAMTADKRRDLTLPPRNHCCVGRIFGTGTTVGETAGNGVDVSAVFLTTSSLSTVVLSVAASFCAVIF